MYAITTPVKDMFNLQLEAKRLEAQEEWDNLDELEEKLDDFFTHNKQWGPIFPLAVRLREAQTQMKIYKTAPSRWAKLNQLANPEDSINFGKAKYEYDRWATARQDYLSVLDGSEHSLIALRLEEGTTPEYASVRATRGANRTWSERLAEWNLDMSMLDRRYRYDPATGAVIGLRNNKPLTAEQVWINYNQIPKAVIALSLHLGRITPAALKNPNLEESMRYKPDNLMEITDGSTPRHGSTTLELKLAESIAKPTTNLVVYDCPTTVAFAQKYNLPVLKVYLTLDQARHEGHKAYLKDNKVYYLNEYGESEKYYTADDFA